MRTFLPLLSLFCLIRLTVTDAVAQGETRPAVLVQGRSSLVNLIDTNDLMKRGQGTAMVFFTTVVGTNGSTGGYSTAVGTSSGSEGYYTRVYGGTPNSEMLTREITRKIDRSLFRPALLHGAAQTAMVTGTVAFAIVDGKPHLRIFLNQEKEDLLKSNDFIAPQVLFFTGPKFIGFESPTNFSTPGIAAARLNVDADGKITGMKLEQESPPGKGFGGQLLMNLKDAKLIPGYRNGKAVACSFTFPMIYKGVTAGSQWKTN